MDLKKVYYYIICLTALFVFFWGVVDLTSAVIGLSSVRTLGVSIGQAQNVSPEKETEQYMDAYYQKKMLYDRLADSLARIIISGIVFGYSRIKVNQLEG